MTLERKSLALLTEAVDELERGFDQLPQFEPVADIDRMRTVLLQLAEKMKDNFPYQHPLYAGQMLKPPHAVARLAYALSLFVNPNNHALDGGRASSAMEKECVAEIAGMFGFPQHLGHLTSGGTMANLEALWVAGKIHPNQKIVASEQSHYTHSRISAVLGLQFDTVACDARARMSVDALKQAVSKGDVGTVVVTLGTTLTGSVDPLPEILELQKQFGFRIHADCAYGGYFILASNLDKDAQAAFACLSEVDSIVVDPHKHGLQPYGCGCVLFRDPSVGSFYKHDSPYTYFSSADLHLGEISLECSRAGSSAAALWATQRMFPLVKGGEFAGMLEQCRTAAIDLSNKLTASGDFTVPIAPELDIVVYLPKALRASVISEISNKIFVAAANQNLHLALASLPRHVLESSTDFEWDADKVTVLRSCLLKSEHVGWTDRIAEILSSCYCQVAPARCTADVPVGTGDY
jgi:glutamate/tyrosine decarboxylase-like PLP-dependent enzyme